MIHFTVGPGGLNMNMLFTQVQIWIPSLSASVCVFYLSGAVTSLHRVSKDSCFLVQDPCVLRLSSGAFSHCPVVMTSPCGLSRGLWVFWWCVFTADTQSNQLSAARRENHVTTSSFHYFVRRPRFTSNVSLRSTGASQRRDHWFCCLSKTR